MTAFTHAIVNCDSNDTPAGRAPKRVENGETFGCHWWADQGQVLIAVALREVRSAGWRRVKLDGRMIDLCPECFAHYRRSNPEATR